jgi:hypothetical protein
MCSMDVLFAMKTDRESTSRPSKGGGPFQRKTMKIQTPEGDELQRMIS